MGYFIEEELPSSVEADNDRARVSEIERQKQETKWLQEQREQRARKINEGEGDE